MQCAAVLSLCLLLLGGAPAGARELDEHPIQKVIGLLEDLAATVKAEAQTEANSYAKFVYWCKSSITTMDKAIAKEKDEIATLEAIVEAKKKEGEALEEQIQELTDQIAQHEAAGAKADEDREKGAELFKTADEDFASTIDAIQQAIDALLEAKGQVSAVRLSAKVHQALALVEMVAPAETRPALAALLQQDVAEARGPAPARPEILAKGDQAGHVQRYKFKSDNVIELLKQLQAQFEEDKLAATKAETNAINAYELAKAARLNAIDAATASKEEKEKLKGDAAQALADAEARLEDVRMDLEADTMTLDETHSMCKTKETEWEERSKTREGELEAIAQAIKILAKVGGVRTEAPGNPVPPPSPLASESDAPMEEAAAASFLQLGSANPRMKVVNFLRAKAKVMHSKALERLAQQMAAHLTGPFDEVNQMIQKMIFRLMAEQKDEDDHKNWCDKEIEKTNSSKANKEEKIEELRVKLEEATAKIAKLGEEIQEANEMVAAIDTHTKEITEIRNIGKEENKKALKDAQDAQAAISNAIAVLEDFYKESGMTAKEPYEFLQQPVELPENPSTWDSSYTGVADPNGEQPGGIITVLKAVSSDFAKMEADTRAQEETDAKAYEDEMSACGIEKARRTKEAEMKKQESERLAEKLNEYTKSKKHVEDELFAVNQYLKDLEPACVIGDSTYEDRKAARTKEIEALKEAQVILEDAFKGGGAPAPAAAFLQRGRQ